MISQEHPKKHDRNTQCDDRPDIIRSLQTEIFLVQDSESVQWGLENHHWPVKDDT